MTGRPRNVPWCAVVKFETCSVLTDLLRSATARLSDFQRVSRAERTGSRPQNRVALLADQGVQHELCEPECAGMECDFRGSHARPCEPLAIHAVRRIGECSSIVSRAAPFESLSTLPVF